MIYLLFKKLDSKMVFCSTIYLIVMMSMSVLPKSLKRVEYIWIVTVLIRDIFSGFVTRVCEDFHRVVRIPNNSFFSLSQDVLFCSLYAPPVNFPFMKYEMLIFFLQKVEKCSYRQAVVRPGFNYMWCF